MHKGILKTTGLFTLLVAAATLTHADDTGAGMKMRDRRSLNADERYHYSHNEADSVTGQDYLGVEKTYYEPIDRGYEKIHQERLAEIKKLRQDKRDHKA